jgi:hypothetical protein
MAIRLRCPTCGGNVLPDPDDSRGVICMLCGRSFPLHEPARASQEASPPRVSRTFLR